MLATLASLIAFNLPHAVADFIPGAGGSIPAITPLEGTPGQIGGLWVCRVDRHNNSFGGGTHANLELHFPTPESIGADRFVLQQSSDGTTAWTNQLFSGEVVQTASGIQDAFYFTPDAGSYYRLLVQGGPHDGNPSNVVYAPPSGIDTQFTGWGLDESMWLTGTGWPWVGRGLEASFSVWDLSAGSSVDGGLSYQWYRVNPFNYQMTPIEGATSLSYTTTTDDLGGYHLICRATGDGETAGGYSQVLSAGEIVVPNNTFASNISESGFRLNFYQSVPSLAAEDLEITYWDGTNTNYLDVTGVTALDGNASFDIAVSIPANATELWLSGGGDCWKIGAEMFEGHFMQQLLITIPSGGFDEWAVSIGLPEGSRGPLDHNGPMNLQNLVAYAMGLNPMTVTESEMPEVNTLDTVAGTVHLIYRRAKNPVDVTLTPRTSTDLDSWSPADVVSETVLEDGGDWEKVDAVIQFTPGPKAFLNFAAEQTAQTPAL